MNTFQAKVFYDKKNTAKPFKNTSKMNFQINFQGLFWYFWFPINQSRKRSIPRKKHLSKIYLKTNKNSEFK